MIGCLPTTLRIKERDAPIQTDFRRALIVMQAMDDPELSSIEKNYIMLDAIIGVENLRKDEYEEALKQVTWYLDGGRKYDDTIKHRKLMDWQQDEQMIFSAVNDVAHQETRAVPYMHWWTFLGYFNEIREGLFSQVLLIRQKQSKGKELDKAEKEFYAENKELIDLKKKLTKEEQEENDRWNKLLGD